METKLTQAEADEEFARFMAAEDAPRPELPDPETTLEKLRARTPNYRYPRGSIVYRPRIVYQRPPEGPFRDPRVPAPPSTPYAPGPAVPPAAPSDPGPTPPPAPTGPAGGCAIGMLVIALSSALLGATVWLVSGGQVAVGSNGSMPSIEVKAPPAVVSVIPSTSTAPTAPAAPAARAVGWSAADCSWAKTTLEQDRELDQEAAANVAAGNLASIPGSQGWTQADLIAYYQRLVSEWDRSLALADRACAGQPASPDACQPVLADFYTARNAHQEWLDTGNDPNAGWDGQWVANYGRLIALFQQVCR